jgi:hypothetical protein
MAVEEKVIIKVEIDSDITNDLNAIERRIKNLDATTKKFNKTNRDLDRTTNKLTNRFSKMTNVLKGFSRAFLNFVKMMGKFSFIALAGHIALVTAGLLAAKAALITGRAAVKLYDVALKGLTVTAAGLATTLAVVSAAMREFQEAQLAPILGGGRLGTDKARGFTSGISSRNLGLLGGEANAAVINQLARSGIRGPQANALITGMFNVTGGDAKAVTTMAAAIGSKNFADARTAVQGAQGFRKGSLAGVSTMGGLIGTVSSGGATATPYQGLSQNMGGTLIGTLKTEFAGQKGLFADLGEPLLGPFRDTFLQISNIIKNDIISMASIIQKFGEGSFAPTLVTTIRAISGWVRENVLEDIDRIEEMGESFVGFFVGVRDFFESMGAWFNKFEPAANLLLDMFRAMGSAAGGRGLFAEFRQLMMGNADNFIKFGEAIGNVIGSLFDRLSNGQTGFFDKLPLINNVLNSLANNVIPALFNLFNTIFPLLDQLPSALDTLSTVLYYLAPIVSSLVSAIATIAGVVNSIGGGDGGGLGSFLTMALLYGGGRKLGVFGKGGRAARQAGKAAAKAGGTFVPGATAANGVRTGAQSALSRGMTSTRFAWTGTGGTVDRLMSSKNPLMRGTGNMLYRGYEGVSNLGSRFAASRGGQVLSSLGKVGKFGAGKLLPGLGALYSGMAVGDTWGNAAETGDMGFGGALHGAMAGAMIGQVVPLIGPLIGGIIGGIVGGVGEWFNSRKGQEKIKREAEKQSGRIMGIATGFQAGSGTDAFLQQQSMMEGFSAAVVAGQDKYGRMKVQDNGKFEGDTDEFGKFLVSMGVNPESVHMDNLFTSLLDKGLLDELEENLLAAEDLYVRQMNAVARITGATAEEIAGFMSAFNLDTYSDYNEQGVGLLMNLFNLDPINRTKSFVGDIDLSTSLTGMANRSASADAALNAFVSGGSMDEALLMDLFNAAAIAEVAMGGSPDLAGYSVIQSIIGMQGDGVFGGVDVVGNFDLNNQAQRQLELISQESGIPVSDMIGKSPTEIDAMMNKIDSNRALYKGVFFGDKSISALSPDMLEGFDSKSFGQYVMHHEDTTDFMRNRDNEGYIEAIMSGDLTGIENVIGQELSQQMLLNFLTETGQYTQDSNDFLKTIADNTAMGTQVIVNAETVEGRGVETVMLEIHHAVVDNTEDEDN